MSPDLGPLPMEGRGEILGSCGSSLPRALSPWGTVSQHQGSHRRQGSEDLGQNQLCDLLSDRSGGGEGGNFHGNHGLRVGAASRSGGEGENFE